MKTSVIIFLAATMAITAGRPWPRDDPEGLKLTEKCEKQANLTKETSTNEAAFSSSFHFSVAFAGSLLLLFGWVYVSRGGFVLSRRKYYSTDDHMWFLMGLISIPWTVLVPISTQSWDSCEGKYEIETSTGWQGPRFWGRMAFVPWILDAVFLWWFLERLFRKVCAKEESRTKHIVSTKPTGGTVPNGSIKPSGSLEHEASPKQDSCLGKGTNSSGETTISKAEPISVDGPLLREESNTGNGCSSKADTSTSPKANQKAPEIIAARRATENAAGRAATKTATTTVPTAEATAAAIAATTNPKPAPKPAPKKSIYLLFKQYTRLDKWFTKRHGWAACICFVSAGVPTAWAAGGALDTRLYLLGTLTVGGLAMFLVVLLTCYKYTNFGTELPHTYAMDDIRIPLLSAGETGLAYILPTPSAEANDTHADPLSPAIGYSLKCEQRLLWDHRSFLEPVYRDTDWDLRGNTMKDISGKCEKPLRNCSKSVQELITSLISRIPDDGSMIQALGVWLYESDEAQAAHSTPTIRSTPESRLAFLPNSTTERYTLIGRDIALALLLWDELIFDRRWQLECGKEHSSEACAECDEFRGKAWGWRERTGTFEKRKTDVRGSTAGSTWQDGLAGLKEAAEKVYRLIPIERSGSAKPDTLKGDEAVDDALGNDQDLTKKAGYLWNVCWKECPSTFGALYLWTTAWYMHYGNATFHTTPLLPEKDLDLWLDYIPSYLTAWRIRWRFLWYGSVACQLMILLPTAFAGLIGLVGI